MKKIVTNVILMFSLGISGAALSSQVLVVGGDGAGGVGVVNRVNAFYDGLAGHSSTIAGTSFTATDLVGIELLWAVQPDAAAYDAAEIAAMSGFLANGGRIAFMGEHGSSFGAAGNTNINLALAALGSAMSIQNGNIQDGGSQTALRANGEILTHSLTTGVDSYNYAAFAPILGASQVLMLGHNLTSVMMAFENIGPGSIFMITDQNVFDSGRLNAGDNQRMFENLLLASTGAPPVNGVPTPAGIALLAIGLLGMRLSQRKKA